ncbi:MAG: PspC domain-containing protein [Chloroflexota bacterium]
MKTLHRSRENRMIAGVAGGLGEYLGVDPTVVRLLIVLSLLVGVFPTVVAYVAAWAIIPEEPIVS